MGKTLRQETDPGCFEKEATEKGVPIQGRKIVEKAHQQKREIHKWYKKVQLDLSCKPEMLYKKNGRGENSATEIKDWNAPNLKRVQNKTVQLRYDN